jgi:hypothetical protein
MSRFIGNAGNDTYKNDGLSSSVANVVERRRHRESAQTAESCSPADSDQSREFATSTATSAARGNPEHIAPIVERVMAGILSKQVGRTA